MPHPLPPPLAVSAAGVAAPNEGRREAAARWVAEHGDALWRFAMARVGSGKSDTAEELVQETLLAAMDAGHVFAGRSTERTWLMGIMAHKIADHFRRRRKETKAPLESGGGRELSPEFTARGSWARRRGTWPDPRPTSQEHQEQAAALWACIEALPPTQGEAVWLREVLGIPTRELCKDLGVSETNLWTRLHRARLALRACLDGKLGAQADDRRSPPKETR